jgi:collagenase-like PrtC family protease
VEITIGPILYDWPKEAILRFYDEAATLDVERVYVGEVVCAKRKGLGIDDIRGVAERLERFGRKVYLSTLAVVSNDEEIERVRGLVRLPYGVEANDMSAVSMAEEMKKEFVVGPHILAYNADDADFLRSVGATRFVMPVELPASTIADIIKNSGVIAEVFGHGRVPLAFSWRCYTARAFGKTKAGCAIECRDFPDGMEIKTLDGAPIFSLNGTSILSADVYTLVDRIDELREMGVRAVRISPHHEHTGRIVEIFRKRIDGKISADEALSELKALHNGRLCNGWYSGRAGKDFLSAIEAESA